MGTVGHGHQPIGQPYDSVHCPASGHCARPDSLSQASITEPLQHSARHSCEHAAQCRDGRGKRRVHLSEESTRPIGIFVPPAASALYVSRPV